MNVLYMGYPYGHSQVRLSLNRSGGRHEVRSLGLTSEADYTFDPQETAAEVIDRVRRSWQPECLVCWLPELVPPPRDIQNAPVKTVAIVSDWNLYYPILEYNLARYDVVLMDKAGVERVHPPGASPKYAGPLYGHAPDVHRDQGLERDIGIVFVGNLNHAIHRERSRCLERLALLGGHYNVVIAGGHFGDSYAELLSRSRIIFNHSIRGEMNMRCFEAIACGGLLMLEAGNLETPDFLRDREEVVHFDSGNLEELVCRYLDNEPERAAIAARGHAKADDLSGPARFDALLDWVDAEPPSDRAFRQFPEEARALADGMQYSAAFESAQWQTMAPWIGEYTERYKDDPAFPAILAQAALTLAGKRQGEEQLALRRSGLEHAQEAVRRDTTNAVLLLNLAFACSANGAKELECRFLEQVLRSNACGCAGLLIGSRSNPLYIRWLREYAEGHPRVETLHVMAAGTLAGRRLEDGALDDAETYATYAMDLCPSAPEPYRIRADIRGRRGDTHGAAEDMAQSLPLAPFDASHRYTLIRMWRDLGFIEAARKLAEETAILFRACEGVQEMAEDFAKLAETI